MSSSALNTQLHAANKAAIENHPRIMQMIILFWGDASFNEMISNLTVIEQDRVSRDMPAGFSGRSGFSQAVIQELIMLQELHSIRHPTKSNDQWGLEPHKTP